MSYNFAYGMDLGAVWTGGAAVEQAIADITQIEMKVSWIKPKISDMGITWQRTAGQMIWSTQLLLMYGGFLYQNMMREELATNTVANAQQAYNDAVKQYGANSEQAIRAARNLENAQMLVARANTMATMMSISFGLQMAATTIQFARQIPQIAAATSAMWGYVTAQAAAHPWLVPAMIAGAVAVGGLAAGYYLGTQQNNITVNLENNSGDFEDAWNKAGRRTQFELRRQSSP